ncbi:MAG: hypothetical protein EON48_00100 [Acetobacteraceae bacterium]|nr:MAG: hypothetical protein EON48_00100 [Acetobacteraceae bacterium]
MLAAIPAAAQSARPDSYVIQSACLDQAGSPLPGRLPFEPGCDSTRSLRTGEPLPYRKHDWPGAVDALPRGYQASDSLLGTLRGAPAAIQTFDFGNTPRAFGHKDPGDGGQVIPLPANGELSAAMTEDASGAPQWFQSATCQAGWLLATPPFTADWQQRLIGLNITSGPEVCPSRLNPSLTRWRSARIDLPWREASNGHTATAPAEVLVSEHFSGTAIAIADHLERFWFARGLGLVRWERWENGPRSHLAARTAMADHLAHSGRCPPIAFGEPPDPGWQMVDCRTWTNFVREAPLPALDWPAPTLR